MRYRAFAATSVAAAAAAAGSLAVFAGGGSAVANTTKAPSAVRAAARPRARALATASSHIYLQLSGVTGDVASGTYAGDFTASAYSWGVSHSDPPVPATSGTGGGGEERPTLSGVTVNVSAGGALGTLSQDALQGRYLPSALITEVSALGVRIRTLALTTVLVSGLNVSGGTYRATGAGLLLGYNTETTTDYASDGTTVLDSYCWDATLNEACQAGSSSIAHIRHTKSRHGV